MTFQVPVNLPEENIPDDSTIKDGQITINDGYDSVSSEHACVSKSHIRTIVRKVAKILSAHFLLTVVS